MKGKTRKKILLVDDDKDMCESLADVLSIDDIYDVKYTTDPFRALDMSGKEDFSLFILDYKMPKMNGIDLLKKIRVNRPDSVIFILTAFISTELIKEAKSEGATKVLSKFIWPNDILEQINEVLG